MTSSPIRHLVVLCHPCEASFNHQVAKTYCNAVREFGHVAVLRDLYALRFDPVLEYVGQVPQMQMVDDLDEVRRCQVLTFIYPIWFGGPPAMMKGYIDRVLGNGFRPHDGMLRGDSPFLRGKRMLTISTSASTQQWLAGQGQLRALRDGFDQYLSTIFELARAERVHLDSIVEGMPGPAGREQLERVREAARAMCADAQLAADAGPRERPVPPPAADKETHDACAA